LYFALKEYEDGFRRQPAEIQGSSQLQDDKFGKMYTKMYNKIIDQLGYLQETKPASYRLMMKQLNNSCWCVDSFLSSFCV
jgi:hypothetical protein